MEYESTAAVAARLGVGVRVVQKWAKEGRVPGAVRNGREWLIPVGTEGPAKLSDLDGIPDRGALLPLLNGSFAPGNCAEFIQSIQDEDARAIAWAEYHYFTGQMDDVSRLVEPYLEHPDHSLRSSALMLYIFANLVSGDIPNIAAAVQSIRQDVTVILSKARSPEQLAKGIFLVTSVSVLLHLPLPPQLPPLEDHIRHLSGGIKLWACYILAHQAYLEQNYQRALAVSETGLSLAPRSFPVAEVYCHLSAVMALMSMRETQRAKEHFSAAWEKSYPDRLLGPFGEHHGLVQGMIEVMLKKSNPAEYEQIVGIIRRFGIGWRKIHNASTGEQVTDDLSTTEFSIAMLYSRGWSAGMIGEFMNVSEKTIRNYISTVYNKLNISNRSMLQQFLLR